MTLFIFVIGIGRINDTRLDKHCDGEKVNSQKKMNVYLIFSYIDHGMAAIYLNTNFV